MFYRLSIVAIVATIALAGCNDPYVINHPDLPAEPFREFRIGPDLGDGYTAIKSFSWGYNDDTPTLWGILDPQDNIVVEPIYTSIKPLPPYIVVENSEGEWLLRKDGSKVFAYPYLGFEAPTEGIGRVYNFKRKVAFFNDKGDVLGGQWFSKARAMYDGMAWVSDDAFMRPDGTQVSGRVGTISDFHHGFAIKRTMEGAAFVDKSLQPVNKDRWVSATNFGGNYAAVQNELGWFLIDKQMHILDLGPFNNIEYGGDGFYHVVRADGLHNIVGDDGKYLFYQWQEELSRMLGGMAVIKKDDKLNLIDTKGQLISEEWFDTIFLHENGVARVGIYGRGNNYITKEGVLINSKWFNAPEQKNKHWFPSLRMRAITAASSNGTNRYGINKNYQITEGKGFHDLKVINRLVISDLGYGYSGHMGYQIMDLDGKLLFNEIYQRVRDSKSGYLLVERSDGKRNLIDSYRSDGHFVSKEWYDMIDELSFGQSCTMVRRNDEENLMFTDGSLLSEPWGGEVFATFNRTRQEMRAIKLNGEYIVMNENCEPITDVQFSDLIDEYDSQHFCVKKSDYSLKWYQLFYDGSIKPVASKDSCFSK